MNHARGMMLQPAPDPTDEQANPTRQDEEWHHLREERMHHRIESGGLHLRSLMRLSCHAGHNSFGPIPRAGGTKRHRNPEYR